MRKFGAVGMMWLAGATVLPAKAGTADIFRDDFDDEKSPEFSHWTSVTGNWNVVFSTASYGGSGGSARIVGNTGDEDDILRVDLSSDGKTQIQVALLHRVLNPLEGEDAVLLEWSPDAGTTWFILDTYTGGTTAWLEESYVLPEAASDNDNLALRLVGHLSGSSDQMGFENVWVSGTVIPEPITLSLLVVGIVAGARKKRFDF